MLDIKYIDTTKKLNINNRTIQVDDELWNRYCEVARRTNLNKSVVNSMMLQYFTDELEALLNK